MLFFSVVNVALADTDPRIIDSFDINIGQPTITKKYILNDTEKSDIYFYYLVKIILNKEGILSASFSSDITSAYAIYTSWWKDENGIIHPNSSTGGGSYIKAGEVVSSETFLQAGEYYIQIYPYDYKTGNYTITTSLKSLPDDDYANSPTDSKIQTLNLNIGDELDISGSSESKFDEDFFHITTNERGILNITCNENPEPFLGVYLLDSDAVEIVRSYKYTSTSQPVIKIDLQAGSYFLKFYTVGSRTGDYQCDVSLSEVIYGDDYTDSIPNSYSPDFDFEYDNVNEIAGEIEVIYDSDIFKIRIPEASFVGVKIDEEIDFAFNLTLFDSNVQYITSSSISFDKYLEPGDYYLRVKSPDIISKYNLNVTSFSNKKLQAKLKLEANLEQGQNISSAVSTFLNGLNKTELNQSRDLLSTNTFSSKGYEILTLTGKKKNGYYVTNITLDKEANAFLNSNNARNKKVVYKGNNTESEIEIDYKGMKFYGTFKNLKITTYENYALIYGNFSLNYCNQEICEKGAILGSINIKSKSVK